MNIKFRDFLPYSFPVTKSLLGIPYSSSNSQSFDTVVAEANIWIDSQRIQVLNLETVILPSALPLDEKKSVASALGQSDGVPHRQFLRVWYRT